MAVISPFHNESFSILAERSIVFLLTIYATMSPDWRDKKDKKKVDKPAN